MGNIKNYIRSCFNFGVDVDAKQYSPNVKLQLLEKREYSIYITPITFQNLKRLQNECVEYVEKATQIWSKTLNNGISFKIINSTYGADIKVHWAKGTINKGGICFTEKFSNKNIYNVTIGLLDINGNEYSSKNIYKIIVLEFGHVVGLGHSEDENDIMYPHWNNVSEPSTNDKLVLNLIYSIGKKSYSESIHLINNYLAKNSNNNQIIHNDRKEEKDIFTELEELGNINKYNLITQGIDLLNHKIIPSFLYKTIWE